MHKIFQIGFSKCGTSSLAKFFVQNGFKCMHWKKKLDGQIKSNIANDRLPLHGLNSIQVFTDSDWVTAEFPMLEQLYPNSSFIYNIRPFEDWIHSMKYGKYAGWKKWKNKYNIVSEKEYEEACRILWKFQEMRVHSYFKGEKNKKLLVFDITKHTGKRIAKFLPHMRFRKLTFPQANKS